MSNELTIYVMLTTDCNLNCRYCYVDKTKGHMKLELARMAVERINTVPNSKVIFFGGEPLLNKEVLGYILRYLRLDIKRGITTNGLLLDDTTILWLKANKCEIAISCDGTKTTHDKWRGKWGGTVLAILRCLKHGVSPDILMTVTPANSKWLLENVKTMYNFGARKIWLNGVSGWSHDYHVPTLEKTLTKLIDWKPEDLILEPFRYFAKDCSEITVRCGAGLDTIAIQPDGRVTPCFRLTEPTLGDLTGGKVESYHGKINKACLNCEVVNCAYCFAIPKGDKAFCTFRKVINEVIHNGS